MKNRIDKTQILGRMITFIIVALVLILTSNMTRQVSVYEEMYQDLGTQVGSLARFFLNTPIWVYWLVSLLVCGILITKDHYVQKTIIRFLTNIFAFLAMILVANIIDSIITSGVYDLMKVIN